MSCKYAQIYTVIKALAFLFFLSLVISCASAVFMQSFFSYSITYSGCCLDLANQPKPVDMTVNCDKLPSACPVK